MYDIEKVREERRTALLMQEYQSMANYVSTFFVMRASILGIGVAMMGALIDFGRTAGPTFGLYFQACVVAVAFVMHKLIGASIRTSYPFAARIAQICSELDGLSYWHIWSHYVRSRPQDGGTWIFVIAQRFVYAGALSYLGVSIVVAGTKDTPTWPCSAYWMIQIIVLLAGTALVSYGFLRIRRDMDPGRFGSSVTSCWTEAIKLVEEDRESAARQLSKRGERGDEGRSNS